MIFSYANDTAWLIVCQDSAPGLIPSFQTGGIDGEKRVLLKEGLIRCIKEHQNRHGFLELIALIFLVSKNKAFFSYG